jgi:hypothetical protein
LQRHKQECMFQRHVSKTEIRIHVQKQK